MSRAEVRVVSVAPVDASVVPVERDPVTGRSTGFDRNRKHRQQDERPSHPASAPPTGRPPPGLAPKRVPGKGTWFVVGAAAVTAAIIVGAVLIVGGNNSATDQAAGVPDSTTVGSVSAPASPVASSAPAAATGGSISSSMQRITSSAAGIPSGTGSGATAPDGSPSARTGAGSAEPTAQTLPAYLDPARFVGYELVQTMIKHQNRYLVGQDVGDVARSFVPCAGGSCFAVPFLVRFQIGQARIVQSQAADRKPCPAGTRTFAITLDPATGAYNGTYTSTAKSGPNVVITKTHYVECDGYLDQWRLAFKPLVGPDLAHVPPNTPAGQNPARVSGYRGTSSAAGKQTPIEVHCTLGLCSLPCRPLCDGDPWFTAGASTWTQELEPDIQTCGHGRTTINLIRAVDGSYSGTVKATYADKVDATTCPKTTTISLKPTAS